MDKEKVVHIMKFCISIKKKNKVVSFAEKLTQIETIVLGEINQT